MMVLGTALKRLFWYATGSDVDKSETTIEGYKQTRITVLDCYNECSERKMVCKIILQHRDASRSNFHGNI